MLGTFYSIKGLVALLKEVIIIGLEIVIFLLTILQSRASGANGNLGAGVRSPAVLEVPGNASGKFSIPGPATIATTKRRWRRRAASSRSAQVTKLLRTQEFF